jgi:hypothetical protein
MEKRLERRCRHGPIRAFLNLIRQALLCLVEAFESNWPWLFTAYEKKALNELYSSIGATSFSLEVLSVRPNNLAVLPAKALGWSDLGEPARGMFRTGAHRLRNKVGVQTRSGRRADSGSRAR